MTRDYWALLDGRRGLICGPHFILHEVTTLGDYVEFYGKLPIFYTYTYTYVFASTLNWQVFLYESIASISLIIFLLISSLTDSHLKINIHIYNDFCDIYHTLTMCFHKKFREILMKIMSIKFLSVISMYNQYNIYFYITFLIIYVYISYICNYLDIICM